ncbi:NADH-ubiquinone oxidoreductase subunit NDUFA12 family protein [Alphaproteobacteria bacterium]|nr:NADH-ubiquinone oxidoreductase subunit NDUFA12 family protein [Alphaproteobacteria bacterium]
MFNNLGTFISTKLFGKNIGTDNFNNFYYISKNKNNKKRWVIYHKNNDSSSVPPEWQAWLTNTSKEIPNRKNVLRHNWQINHAPNLTGLNNLYNKSNESLDKHDKTYSVWTQNNNKEVN